MRTFSARVMYLLLGMVMLAMWPPAVLWVLMDAAVGGHSVVEAWRRSFRHLRELAHDWFNAMRDPLNRDNGAYSGI